MYASAVEERRPSLVVMSGTVNPNCGEKLRSLNKRILRRDKYCNKDKGKEEEESLRLDMYVEKGTLN